jgi:citrate synthase
MVDQRRFNDQHRDRVTLDAREAAAFLGVDRRTLYAYVARGQLRSFPSAAGRARLYPREDLERLRTRSHARGGHGAVAAGALRFGEAILDSAITAVEPAGIRYRGVRLDELLASGASFEATAELLWSGALPVVRPRWQPRAVPWSRVARLVHGSATPLAVLPLVVAAVGALDPDGVADEGRASLDCARGLIRALAVALAPGLAPARTRAAARADGVVEACAAALGCADEERRALELALVLSADHELNPSTFAARVAASTGAGLSACVGAALAVMNGPRHGAASLRVEALIEAVGRPARAAAAVRERARRGETIPGFGHPLYRDGDPRARPLLEAAAAIAPRSPRVRTLLAIVDAMRDAGRDAPNLDVGLGALGAALDLPRGAAGGVFALGRSAGWIAHVLEQRTSEYVIRPRARYVGS